MKYDCLRCGMEFNQKNHLICHLNRKNICKPILEPISIEEVKKYYSFDKNHKNESKMNPNESKMNPNESKMNPNESKMNPDMNIEMNPNESKKGDILNPNESKMDSPISYKCSFCVKCYSTNSNMRKHEKKCKRSNNLELKKEIKEMKEEHHKEILELKETVKILINNSDSLYGNTTNNNNNTTNNTNNENCNNTNNITNNTININNYGSENKDYITKDYLIKLLKEPFQAIPRLIEYTHFNKDHPENQNIKLPNKKQPYVKVLRDDKWVYADRKSTILDLIDEKHCELNDGPLITHIENKFSEHLQDRFERFNERYLNDEKDFTTQLYKETELVMINNS